MFAEQPRRFRRQKRREPQACFAPRGFYFVRQRGHARWEFLVGFPIAEADLPAVVHLQDVEGEVAEAVENLVEDGFVNQRVKAVPRAPDTRRGPRGGKSESLAERLRIGRKGVLFRAKVDEPFALARFVPAFELTAVQADMRVHAERAEEDDPAVVHFRRADPRSVRERLAGVGRVRLEDVEDVGFLNRERGEVRPRGEGPGLPSVAVKRAGRPRQVQGHARGGDGLGGGSRVGDEDVHAGIIPRVGFARK